MKLNLYSPHKQKTHTHTHPQINIINPTHIIIIITISTCYVQYTPTTREIRYCEIAEKKKVSFRRIHSFIHLFTHRFRFRFITGSIPELIIQNCSMGVVCVYVTVSINENEKKFLLLFALCVVYCMCVNIHRNSWQKINRFVIALNFIHGKIY